MAKKTVPQTRPRPAGPVPPVPDREASGTPAPGAARRPSAKPPAAADAKPSATASTKARASRPGRARRAAGEVATDPLATAGPIAARRPRRVSQLPTQALEQTQTPAPVPPPETVSDEDIRIRAYFLSLERGPHAGSETDFWLQAEQELRPKNKR